MRCLISKIIIDSREGSDKPLPGIVRKHLKSCRDCNAYMNLGKQLRDSNLDSGISESSINELNQKIFSNIDNLGKGNIVKLKSWSFPSVPVAASLFIIVLSLGIILYQNINKPSEIRESSPLVNILAVDKLKNFNNIVSNMESPILKEAEGLKKSINSAKEYLRSALDFGLPGIPN